MSRCIVSFSVVTYNSANYIGGLLESIIAHVKAVDYHIYVIDNGSNDGTADIVRARDARVTLIQSEKNVGFGAAHNMVLDRLDSKYHVIVNPDIYFDYDVISGIAAYLDHETDVGMVAPKLLFPDGRVQSQAKRDPKLLYLISRRFGFGFLKKYRDQYEMTESGDNNVFDIEFASGCFMFLRTAIFKSIHGFDTRYFLYFEDADLSRELRRYARIQYNPDFYVYHNWERGGAKNMMLFLKQIVSMFKYINKWKKSEKE